MLIQLPRRKVAGLQRQVLLKHFLQWVPNPTHRNSRTADQPHSSSTYFPVTWPPPGRSWELPAAVASHTNPVTWASSSYRPRQESPSRKRQSSPQAFPSGSISLSCFPSSLLPTHTRCDRTVLPARSTTAHCHVRTCRGALKYREDEMLLADTCAHKVMRATEPEPGISLLNLHRWEVERFLCYSLASTAAAVSLVNSSVISCCK